VNAPAVFDCMVFLQAAARPHRVHLLFDAINRRELTLFVSPEIIAEVHDVLTRPSVQRQFSALTPEVVKNFLADVLARATLVTHVPMRVALPRDPKDEKYLNLAIAVNARYLVSADNDLLDLMTDPGPESRNFRSQFPSLRILKSGTLIRELEMQRGQNRP